MSAGTARREWKVRDMQDAELWSEVMGAEASVFGFVRVTFVSGDWETPGLARVVVADPDDPTVVDGDVMVNVKALREAVAACNAAGYCDPCTGEVIAEGMEWDACTADTVLQYAACGEVIYG